MSTTQSTEEYLDSFNFTGGYPTSKDLAPSIVFAIVYFGLTGVMIWRWISPATRTMSLIRPSLFCVIRIATWILRAVMSKTSYGEGELIAELVFVSIGFLFLISPIISLWEKHVLAAVPKSHQPEWVKRGAKLAQLTLIAAIGTGVAGSALVGNTSDTDTIIALRKASYILSLAVVAITLLCIITTHRRFGLDSRGTLFLIVVCLLCLIVAIYRVVQLFTTNPSAPVRSITAFYILQATMEVFAVGAILSVNLNVLFPGPGEQLGSDRVDSNEMIVKEQQGMQQV